MLAVASKISFAVDYSLDDSPKNMTRGELSIKTVSGENFSVTISEPYGAAPRALSKSSLDEKFRSCCQYAASPMCTKKIDQLIEVIDSLENEINLSENLFPLLG